MVDVASIIVAVIGLAAGILSVGITTYFTYWSDERKRQSESEKLLSKYRDPLLLSCTDLQSRLFNITDGAVTGYFRKRGERRENLLLYTAFLVGQYLSWTHILRRQTQFLRFDGHTKNKTLTELFAMIGYVLNSDRVDWSNAGGAPFMLWRAEQLAIGEIMTVSEDNDHLFCMGYAEFHRRWNEDRGFANVWGRAGEVAGNGLPAPIGDHQDASRGDVGNLDGNNEKEDLRTAATTTTTTTRNAPGHSRWRIGGVSGHDHHQVNGAQNNVIDAPEYGEDEWNSTFRRWFRPLIEGVTEVSIAKNRGLSRVPDQRLRRLQHMLLDLIHLLDDSNVRSDEHSTRPCHRADDCPCSRCKDTDACFCRTCASRQPAQV